MEHWEFLIQKEGDQAWLPLESPTAEILEGRYRVIARAHHPNTAVNIEIIHQYEVDGVTRKLGQRRSQQLNDEGLVAIMPFTYLHPGLWNISCSGTETTATNWQRLIQLQVLFQEVDAEDWDYHPAASDSFEQATADKLESEIEQLNQIIAASLNLSESTVATSFDDALVLSPITAANTVTESSLTATASQIESDAEMALAGSEIRKPRSPELPRFTHPTEPLSLRAITGPSLPPQIHPSQLRDIQEPQLPGFAASPPLLAAYFQESSLSTTIEAEFNRSPVELAFAALQLRQRFWATLNILAQDSEPLPNLQFLLEPPEATAEDLLPDE